MTNAFKRREAQAPKAPSGPSWGTQAWCDWRNSTMLRDDICWRLNRNGTPYLDWKR